MTLWQAILLGIVEGLTEFLPVSSTGHLILVQQFMDMDKSILDNYTIIIQLGAILAVVFYYWKRVLALFRGCLGADPRGRRLLIQLLIAFLPAAVIGLLFHDWIEAVLFDTKYVAIALVAGGIAMILVEQTITLRKTPRVGDAASGTYLDALWIGIAQCLSLWPGTSRSMATIVGAQLRGYSNLAAAEFSFLLALPTLGAATVYKLFDAYGELSAIPGVMTAIVVGNIVSFAVALLAVWGFIKLVNRIGMTPFGIYRIILGIGVAVLIWMGWM